MRCMKCGQPINGTIADSLGHACTPQPKIEENLERPKQPLQAKKAETERRLDHLLERAADIDPDTLYERDDLDHEIELANRRDLGPGREREDRFGDRESEKLAARNPAFDADAEVPTDPLERAEFKAREMRFPNEQRAALGERPWDKGLVTYLLTPEELAEFRRIGKVPEVPEERKRHADREAPAPSTI